MNKGLLIAGRRLRRPLLGQGLLLLALLPRREHLGIALQSLAGQPLPLEVDVVLLL